MREPTGIVDGPSLRPLIRPCGPPSPQGEGPAGGRAKTSLEKGGGICEANAGGFLVSCLQKPPVTAYRRRQPPFQGGLDGRPQSLPHRGRCPSAHTGAEGALRRVAPSVSPYGSTAPPTRGELRAGRTHRCAPTHLGGGPKILNSQSLTPNSFCILHFLSPISYLLPPLSALPPHFSRPSRIGWTMGRARGN